MALDKLRLDAAYEAYWTADGGTFKGIEAAIAAYLNADAENYCQTCGKTTINEPCEPGSTDAKWCANLTPLRTLLARYESEGDPQTRRDDRLLIADEYEAGLHKMEASGYEEWADTIKKHKVIIAALRGEQ